MGDIERNKQIAMRAPYSYITETTFYTRHGDWFAWACAIISLVLIYARFNFRVGVMR
jgi:apolipoprotein N-acyltransferase